MPSETHGHRKGPRKQKSNGQKNQWDPTYGSWREMKRRCLDPKRSDFQYYGAVGIQVCPQWIAKPGGFEQFLKDVGKRPDGHTLDRINPYGHYEPGNVRWVPTLENSSGNRRSDWDRDYGPPPEDSLFQIQPKWPELLVDQDKPETDEEEIPF